ncbi:MAG TPA: 2Fe-2S iron-sulfur cluster-binding protein, partial [Verrucomicrobiae bacterium]|nr:2Fe-2S iron-sulfur cluster-binding protein [Verrucomicrobiae bacterium]
MTTVALTLLPAGRTLDVEAGSSILKAAHAAGVDIEATCGGRGRCTSCRVKFVAGTIPPPTIMDEVQLGDALVREGYRLSCQCRISDAVTVQVSPPVDERTFQILGGERPEGAPVPVRIEAGIAKTVVRVTLSAEEHHQTSDLEAVLEAVGGTPEDCAPEALKTLPQALREHGGEVTVATFGSRILSIEA